MISKINANIDNFGKKKKSFEQKCPKKTAKLRITRYFPTLLTIGPGCARSGWLLIVAMFNSLRMHKKCQIQVQENANMQRETVGKILSHKK